jgi:RNA polymerase sigma-70 factor (ECF subfamily)
MADDGVENPQSPHGARGPSRFPTTRWYLLDQAAHGDHVSRRQALGELLRLYTEPIRAFVIAHRGVRPDQADDVVQEFLAVKWLQQDLLARVRPEKGRFRSYLLTALDHYVSNWLRAQRRAKALVAGTDPDAPDPADPAARPEEEFDLVWARNVVRRAVERMRVECLESQRADVWAVFEARILGPILGQSKPPGYAELVSRFGFASPVQASNVLVTAKRTFVRALREVILEYEGEDSDVEAEIADLQRILGQSQG